MSSILRAFENDAFVSHNSYDTASMLAGALEEHGTKVFCDEATDLSDRRVTDRIGAALMRSRCVVVHIPANFRDSEWCRAEYTPALHLGQSLGFIRVVVARGSDTAALPPGLSAVPQFNLPDEIGLLGEFLIRLNTVPDEIAAEVQAQRNGLRAAALGTDQAVRARGTELLELVSSLRHYVDQKYTPETELLDAGEQVARRFINSADVDDRTNGHRALILLAALQEERQLLRDIKEYICREPNEGVLIEILNVYLSIAHLPAGEDDLWLAAALLRATAGVKTISTEHKFLMTLPDSVRCRVMQGGIGLGVLSIFERATLLDRRLEHLLKKPGVLGLEPLEIEGLLRELLPYIDMVNPETGAKMNELYGRLIERVLVWSEHCGGEPIRNMGEYACDVLVEPLARLMTERETSLETFEWACQLVEEQTTARELVNRLRVMGHLVRAGVSWRNAQAQTYEAWSHVARRRRLLGYIRSC